MLTFRISKNELEKLKQIHFKRIGIMLSDSEANLLGLDILNYLEVVGPTPPDKNNQELDK